MNSLLQLKLQIITNCIRRNHYFQLVYVLVTFIDIELIFIKTKDFINFFISSVLYQIKVNSIYSVLLFKEISKCVFEIIIRLCR